jgi:hypothetical protein
MERMETFSVHKIDENLVISLNKLPGFGKLCTCALRHNEESKYIDVYYAGGFFKRQPDSETLARIKRHITTCAQNFADRRGMIGTITRINFTSAIRLEKENGRSDVLCCAD